MSQITPPPPKIRKTMKKRVEKKQVDKDQPSEDNFIKSCDILFKKIADEESPKPKSSEFHFVAYVEKSLTELPTILQCGCKNEMNNVLFKYQTQHLMAETNSAQPGKYNQLL